MSLADLLQKLWKSESKKFVYARIPLERQDSPIAPTKLEAEKHYFRLWLSEAFLADDRRLFREFVPVVHSNVRLTFADNPAQELPYVAGPINVGLGEGTLGKGVQINHALTNLLPFRGGTIGVSAALVAYKSNDYLNSLVGLLNKVSGLLNTGQLSSVVKVASGAADGVQDLLGMGDKDVHLIYSEDSAGTAEQGGADFVAGYTAVIRASQRDVDPNRLFVKGSRLCVGSSLADATPLKGFDYMLLRQEVASTRDDFRSFTEIARMLKKAIEAGIADPDTGRQILKAGRATIWDLPDLTRTDRVRVASALSQEFEEATGGTGTRSLESRKAPGPEGLDAVVSRISEQDVIRSLKALGRSKLVPLERFLAETDVKSPRR